MSQEETISYSIPYVVSGPVIDGEITEGEWSGAERVNLIYETSPSQNIPAIVDTEVFMMEDGINFYLAFIAYDPDPDKICSFYRDRDTCWDDDLVGVVIDTFNDERRAFEFFSNPFGVQMDRINIEGSRGGFGGQDNSWNAIWDSAGQVTDEGYVVEIKIPLDQLRFSGGLDKQTWGIELVRYYPRDRRHKLSNNTRDYNLSCYLCQLTKAQGFNQLEEKLNLRFVPAVTGSYSESRQNPNTDEWQDSSKLDVGMDIRWGINQNFYLNATINPDFSQVEADSAQLDVNNTFSLFYPERREFFLEGADYFNTRANLVHTRNIGSPDYGIKLTGKSDVHSFGLFFANDENTNFVIPGNQGSFIALLENKESLNTAYRYSLDVNRNTSLGMIFTDRRADDYSNTVAGIDGNVRIGSSDSVEMQLIRSHTEYPTMIQTFYGQKPVIDDYAYHLSYRHEDNNWSWGGRYTEYGDDFRADMGFITRVDYKEYDISAGHNWRFGPESKFSRFFLGGDFEKSYDESGKKMEEMAGLRINVQGPLQSFMFAGFNIGERFYNGKYFDEKSFFIFGHIRPSGNLEIGADISFGDSIDYFNTRLGKEFSVGPQINMHLGKHFQMVLQHNFQKMEIDGKKLYSTNLSDLRLIYQFGIRSFLRIILQYSDTKRDKALYIFDVDSRSKNLTSQVLYSYKINPQTRFFIGYSDTGYQDDEMSKIGKTNRTLFTKFSYAW
ncbi:DUF5916 domain-containing protein [Thermodesulfobacteriota bacterium]